MSEKLQFSIGVDLSELDAGLNDAGKEIKKFTDANKRQFERAGLAVAGLGASIVAIAQDVGGAGSQISRTFENIANAISEGDIPTLIGLVTSAIGILIGLIPTIVSGIALIRTAFAALSLTLSANPIGAVVAAIGLAIVGVIAAVQLFSNSVEKLAVKKDVLNEVSLAATKSLAKEKAELLSLLAVAKDVTLPYENRLKAVRKLNEISPEYLGNIRVENLETRETVAAINAYSEAILKKARAQAANKLLSENIEKQLKLETSTLRRVAESISNVTNEETKARLGADRYNAIKAESLRFKNLILNANSKELAALKAEEQAYLDIIRALGGVDIELKKVAESKKLVNTPQVSGINLPQPLGIAPQVGGAITSDLSGLFQVAITESELYLLQMEMMLIDFNTRIDEFIQSSLVDTFSGIGDAIGNALATGTNVAQAIGKTLLKSMGSFLSSLGKQMIAFGTTALFFDKVKKSLFTGVGTPAAAAGLIAAGIALSAIGSAIASSASSGGVGGGGGGASQSYSQAGSTSSSSFSAQSGNEVVFRISGNDLLGVLRRAEGNEQRLG
jgi:hypothetical protein